MTDIEILGALGFLVGFFSILFGLIVAVALACNQLAYWLEARHTEHDGHQEVVDRCNVYSLRPRPAKLDEIRARRGDAA